MLIVERYNDYYYMKIAPGEYVQIISQFAVMKGF